jgi:hypothetical protein
MQHAMSEKQHRPFQFSINVSIKVGFPVPRVTYDGGLFPVREIIDA